ncbi:unnamed protein product [Tenebrio molitor]|nr:unnamed protein product [Tenebrio molitor]
MYVRGDTDDQGILLYLRDRRCTLILTFVAVLLLVIVVVVLNVLQEVGLSTR